MTAAPVRLGSVDTEVPRLVLAGASGAVEVNGSGELPARSGPPRPRSPDAVLSPARAALRDHLATIDRLSADCERARRPVAKLIEQSSRATAELSAAEHALDKIDNERASTLVAAARTDGATPAPVPPSPGAGGAEAAAVDRARREINSTRMALDEVRQDEACASAALREAHRRLDGLLLAVLVEEFAPRLDQWALARDVYYSRESELYGLLESIGERGRKIHQETGNVAWLQKLETLRPPWASHAGHVELSPRSIGAAGDRWSSVLERLKTDAGANFD